MNRKGLNPGSAGQPRPPAQHLIVETHGIPLVTAATGGFHRARFSSVGGEQQDRVLATEAERAAETRVLGRRPRSADDDVQLVIAALAPSIPLRPVTASLVWTGALTVIALLAFCIRTGSRQPRDTSRLASYGS